METDDKIQAVIDAVASMALPENFQFGLKTTQEDGVWFVDCTYRNFANNEINVLSVDPTFDNKEDAERCKEAIHLTLVNRGGASSNRITS